MDLDQYDTKDIPFPLVDELGNNIFQGKGFDNFELVVYRMPGDCSCFFHCVLMSHYIPYRKKMEYGVSVNRRNYCADFRKQVADSLYEKQLSPGGSRVRKYDLLAGGNIESFASHIPLYKIENLHAAICNYRYSVGEEILEIIKDVIEQNIFILDVEKGDVYNGLTGTYYNEKWPSIVLLYHPTPKDDSYVGHYDLVGVPKPIKGKKLVVTHFQNKHSFVQFLLKRENQLNKEKKKV